MTALDLSTFGPWREAFCGCCQKIRLVTGPVDGAQQCKACWFHANAKCKACRQLNKELAGL